MSGDTDFGREKQCLSRMEQQWPGLLYLCRTLSNLQPILSKTAIPSARVVSTVPYLLGQMHHA